MVRGGCLFSKRLERGTFELPAVPSGVQQVAIEPAAFTALLDGIPLSTPRRKWYRRAQAA